MRASIKHSNRRAALKQACCIETGVWHSSRRATFKQARPVHGSCRLGPPRLRSEGYPPRQARHRHARTCAHAHSVHVRTVYTCAQPGQTGPKCTHARSPFE